METVFIWFLLSVGVGIYAGNKGRSGLGFFFLAMIISPLLGMFFAFLVKDLSKKANEPTPETHVRCPECKELVRNDARKCKHCGCALVPQSQRVRDFHL